MTTGIRWLSLLPGSGYGDASENYLHGLREIGVPVSWTPLGWGPNSWCQQFGPLIDPNVADCQHHDIVHLGIDYDTVVVHGPPVWHESWRTEEAGRYLVAMTTWETDRLPPGWVSILNRFDKVLVPSRFNAERFGSSGITCPIEVVPHASRPAASSEASAVDHIGRGGTNHGLHYLIGTWTARKAIVDAVEAFVTAFGAGDDVSLVIQTTPGDLMAQARFGPGTLPVGSPRAMSWFSLAGALNGRPNLPPITLRTRRVGRAGIDALHEQGGCFLSLSRGEGFGLGAFDAGAHGNPVIITGWGGSLDYLPDGYPYCVDYELVPTTTDEPDAWWTPRAGERWARADITHAAKLLRRIYEDREESRWWGSALRSYIEANFDRPQITRRLLAALGRPPERPEAGGVWAT